MLEPDTTKLTSDQVEQKPGVLPAKIILNMLIEKDYCVWLISNVMGNMLFNVTVGSGAHATVGFTDVDLAISYCNRKEIRRIMLRNFGRQVNMVQMSLMRLHTLVTPQNAHLLGNIIVNPNSRDFFAPIPMEQVAALCDAVDYDPQDDDVDICELTYNRKEKLYEPSDDQPMAV